MDVNPGNQKLGVSYLALRHSNQGSQGVFFGSGSWVLRPLMRPLIFPFCFPKKKRINTHPTFNFLFDTQKHGYNYSYIYIHKQPPPPCSVDDFIIPKKKTGGKTLSLTRLSWPCRIRYLGVSKCGSFTVHDVIPKNNSRHSHYTGCLIGILIMGQNKPKGN